MCVFIFLFLFVQLFLFVVVLFMSKRLEETGWSGRGFLSVWQSGGGSNPDPRSRGSTPDQLLQCA